MARMISENEKRERRNRAERAARVQKLMDYRGMTREHAEKVVAEFYQAKNWAHLNALARYLPEQLRGNTEAATRQEFLRALAKVLDDSAPYLTEAEHAAIAKAIENTKQR